MRETEGARGTESEMRERERAGGKGEIYREREREQEGLRERKSVEQRR